MYSLTIIVPVYNGEKTLERCLNNLVVNSLDNYYIFIVDDGSNDNSKTISEKFVSKYSNIKYYYKENGGLGDARNFGMKFVATKYVGFVDCDDYIDELMYVKMLDDINDLDMVECNFNWVRDNKISVDYPKYSYDDYSVMLQNLRVLVCNKIFKMEVINNHNILFQTGIKYEDICFTYRFVAVSTNFKLIEDAMYNYIQYDNSLSNHQTKDVADIFSALECTKSNCNNNEIEYLFIRILLGSSFKRVLKVKDKKFRDDMIDDTMKFLYDNYPNWKKSVYIKKFNLKNIYYKLTNKYTLKLINLILGG